MANYHGTMKLISRSGGKSCVAALSYRSASKLQDFQTGQTWDYTNKPYVGHVEILLPTNAPQWVLDISNKLEIDKPSALQRLSNVFEESEKRKDSQVYREFEFSLPNELTNEQNIKWATEFVQNVFVNKGMLAVTNFHFDIDKDTGEHKPHCHVLLSTRELTEDGFGLKQREWNNKNFLLEVREQCAAYQNFALKEHGFEVRVDHRSYEDRFIDIEGHPKLGSALLDMAKRGLKLDKLDNFNAVKLKNQFKILKNPELVFSIVTSNHSTFTKHDVARVLNRYIDDVGQFQTLHDRLTGSKNLVPLDVKDGQEQVYTTREMLRIEMGLVNCAESMVAQQTHKVDISIIDKAIAEQNKKVEKHGSLSADQEKAIRHMLSGEQISCVVGFAGAGKTTSLEAAKEAWEASGYKVLGLAPTGKAARNIEDCGVRSLTVHKFLHAQEQGREHLSSNSVVVLDEAGMVDSRRFAEILAIIDRTGAKIVPMGDNSQLQAVEAGPAFRLLVERVKPVVLETIVRQREGWQKEATRLFGMQQADKALALYLEKGAFKIIEETPRFCEGDIVSGTQLLDKYCLARQMSGRIWKEMVADYEKQYGKVFSDSLEPEQIDFKRLSQHQDYSLYKSWKGTRYNAIGGLIDNFNEHKQELQSRGVDIQALGKIVEDYSLIQGNSKLADKSSDLLKQIDNTLRQMSYTHLVDTRQGTKEVMVEAWLRGRRALPEASHLMLAFTNRDTISLNEVARQLMRQEGIIKGQDFTYTTHSIEKDDFGKETITKHKRMFAEGDRILFTSNNTGLGVKNGTLGTIVFLNQNKIKVLLDGKGYKEVSFAPKLYPYIDNGWATNIHKSQGVTVEHAKRLASFEEYRNLAYVGMTRHQETLEVFGSSLDFWREEKVIDRLSRVQEKLSGFDYINAEKIEELIKEDARILWYEQKIQDGKDLWAAIKGTAKSAVDQVFERSRDTITVDPLASFEHSEERRSSQLVQEIDKSIALQKHRDEPTVSNASSESEAESKAKTTQSKSLDTVRQSYQYKTVIKERFLSFEEVEAQLKERIYDLATDLLGNPTSRTSTQLRFGRKGSVCIFTGGSKKGLYANHESSIYGGPLKLIEEQAGLSSAREAKDWAMNWLGGKNLVIEQRVVQKAQKTEKAEWTPIIPVPREAENPDIVNNKYLNIMLKGGAKEVDRYAYRDAVGNLKGYVIKIEKADGSKITPPLSYCQNDKGFKAWVWQAFEKESKTPYGIEKLAQDTTKPILIVEGEKTCDAAQKLLPECHVLTWSGGAGNVSKTNWYCLVGKDVAIWPDNDKGGIQAANTLQKIVISLNDEKGIEGSIKIVTLPENLPHKWDLADKLPDGWSAGTVKEMIHKQLPEKHSPEIKFSLEDISKILRSRGLRTLISPDLEEKVNQTYKSLIFWKERTTDKLTHQDKSFILERATIVEALKPKIESRYDHNHSPIDASQEALEVSLVAAQLVQHNIIKGTYIGWEELINKAQAAYKGLPLIQRTNQLLEGYEKNHPEYSKEDHKFLDYYQQKCFFMNDSKLTTIVAKNILKLAKEWRELAKEDAHVQHCLSEMMKEQPTGARKKVPETKENALKELERSFVRTSLSYRYINEHNCQERIHEALAQKQQEHMEREQREREILQKQLQQRKLSKGAEMEL